MTDSSQSLKLCLWSKLTVILCFHQIKWICFMVWATTIHLEIFFFLFRKQLQKTWLIWKVTSIKVDRSRKIFCAHFKLQSFILSKIFFKCKKITDVGVYFSLVKIFTEMNKRRIYCLSKLDPLLNILFLIC